MNRLQGELRRLFLHDLPAAAAPGTAPVPGQARALVLSVAAPAAWEALAGAWQGVQAELQLPAPAIAASGHEAMQLWFSLAEPVPEARLRGFAAALVQAWLPKVAPERVRIATVAGDAGTAGPGQVDAADLPPREVAPGRWSAFVAADLAALFSDEPSLDHPLGLDAQAELLSRIRSATPEAFERACQALEKQARDAAAPAEAPPGGAAAGTASADPASAGRSPGTSSSSAGTAEAASAGGHPGAPWPAALFPATRFTEPRAFLLQVMNDGGVPLPLRMEAAKVLLAAPGHPASAAAQQTGSTP